MEPISKLILYGKKKTENNVDIYEINTGNRDSASLYEIPLKQNDKLLQLELNDKDSTTWFCDASTLHEIFPKIDPALGSQLERSSGEVVFFMPEGIEEPVSERGIIGKIGIKILRVFIKDAVSKEVGDLAKKLEDKHLLHQLENDNLKWKSTDEKRLLSAGAGLFLINKKFEFQRFENTDLRKPILLLIHGTNSDTIGAFSHIYTSAIWKTIQQVYGNNIVAFQHRTLTESPLENAVKLAQLLPHNAEVHIVSHSRGGLIGDILCKYNSHGESAKGFTNYHLELLEKEGRSRDIENIEALNKIYKKKKLLISKFIRVACPAAGTQLASKRLDYILNVFFNLSPGIFTDLLYELISTALKNKYDTDVLPGIEAMNPDSVFIEVLNDPAENNAIDGSNLAVISGNGNVSFSGRGLMAILAKLFFWKRNDLVVNTDSMYLGVRRKNKIQYFFSQGTEVNHLNYFSTRQTAEALELAIVTAEGKLIPGFRSIPQYEIPGSDRGLIEYGELYPEPFPPKGKKPIVILLPGIMGSNLVQDDKEIWLHYGRIITGGLMNMRFSSVNDIHADSVVKTSYFKMYKWLKTKYDVVVHPFDWRKPLAESTNDFNDKVKALLKLEQPIKIIGHSMGGVLVRDFMIYHPETWQVLNTSKDFRLIFLGAPLGGSHRILTVLFGKDAIIKKLSKIDLFNTKQGLLSMFCKFPGILSLLPLTTDDNDDFSSIDTWERMRLYFGKRKWPLPSEEDLAFFKTYRNKILDNRKNIDYSNTIYIAGKDRFTPCDYYLEDLKPGKKLQFLYTGEGDQSVTWKLGIPKELDPSAVYYTDVSHGSLANNSNLFSGIEEILSSGKTTSFSHLRPLMRGEEKIFRGEPEIDFDLSPSGLEKTLLGIGDERNPIRSSVPVSVSVSNGDLRYASFPVLTGHFKGDGIIYTEKTIDTYMDGSLLAKNQLGLYPGEIGTNDYFEKFGKNDFPGAIVIGLGQADELTLFQLSKTVEQGVLNYLLAIRRRTAPKNGIGISTLLVASGYGGLSIENSLKAIIDGINRANAKMSLLFIEDFKTIQHIEFVEVYADRALNAMYAVHKIVADENSTYNIIIGRKKIRKLLGIRRMVPLDNSEGWWNRITIKYRKENKLSKEPAVMIFGASTSDSREEENMLYSSTPMIDLFISEISTSNNWSACTAKTLFELLIPNPLKERLRRKGNISLIVDSKTASYPWELLQDDTNNSKPLCINAGMIRQLSTKDYRMDIKRVSEKLALVIADPLLNEYIPQLPAAKREGEVVKEIFESSGYIVNDLINSEASAIIRELFCKDYSLIHLAGHGVYEPDAPRKSGMVIGRDLFLSVFEIQQMGVVPEMVFVNCCHLGYSSHEDENLYQQRYKLAANIGTELIGIGVKAVIAAGWAVSDEGALEFAKTFYNGMFAGDSFGEAVKKARNAVYETQPNNNTWGAYQCYGDPYFRLMRSPSDNEAGREYHYIVPQEAEIDLDNLLNQLEMGLTINEDPLKELLNIMEAVERDVDKTAGILEKQGEVLNELGLYAEAKKIYEDLLSEESADFSFSCMERYCNVRAKFYVKEIMSNPNATAKDKQDAFEKIDQVTKDLEVLISTGKTAERLNVLGSTYKRMSILAPYKDKKTRIKIIKKAIACYDDAFKIDKNKNKGYSLVNAIALKKLLALSENTTTSFEFTLKGKKYTIGTDQELAEELKVYKGKVNKEIYDDELEFYDLTDKLKIEFCLLLIGEGKNLDSKLKKMEKTYKKMWDKAGSPGKKAAELENLEFIIIALNEIAGIPLEEIKSISGSNRSQAGLEEYFVELKRALIAVRKVRPDKEQVKPAES